MVIPAQLAEKGAAPLFREPEETRRFYIETFLHTESFIHKLFYRQTFLHSDILHIHIQRLLHKNTLTHRRFYIQVFFTHIYFYMQMLFYITHKHFYTQILLHTDTSTETFTQKHSQSAAPLKASKHNCNGNTKKSQKYTNLGSILWLTLNLMQGIRSLRYKISLTPWYRG